MNSQDNESKKFWKKPAFYAHVLSALSMTIAIVIFIVNYKKVLKLDTVRLIQIFALLAISIASHGESHISLEKHYGYDPISYILQ